VLLRARLHEQHAARGRSDERLQHAVQRGQHDDVRVVPVSLHSPALPLVFTQLTSSCRCGGGYRIQIYASADAQLDAAALPTGWAQTAACAQDGSSRVYADTNLTTLANNTPRNCIGASSFIICSPERRANA
jgi:hypothetical protein